MRADTLRAAVAAIEALVAERVDARLAELGVGAKGGEYSSLAPPACTSRRSFREQARRMLAAGAAGVRREGRGRRDAVYYVDRAAWHASRTSARVDTKPAGPSDDDLAERSLRGAGLRLVGRPGRERVA